MRDGLLGFYQECFRRAFRGRFKKAVEWAGLISLAGLLLLAVRSSLPPATERLLQIELPIYFFVGVFSLTVLAGLMEAPYGLWREERLRSLHIENLRTPKLQLNLPRPDARGVALAGNTTEAYGGRRVTVTTQWISEAVYLLCTNIGETEAKGCRARVLWAERETAGKTESAGILEAIELPWSKKDPEEHLTADIAPGDTCRIWLAAVRQNGSLWVFREKDELPINYQQVFGEEGRHRILLQVDSDTVAPTQLLLSIRTEAAKPPEGSGMWTPTVAVELIAQGGPVLDHPDIPQRITTTAKLT